MKIRIKQDLDFYTVNYYDTNYDILPTPDNNTQPRLLKPTRGIQYFGDDKNKKCRFCGKSQNEVSFKKIAHIFPESIGNKSYASNYECDNCNQYFGNTIENSYSKFFSLYHSIMQIHGKRGIPKCSFKISCNNRTDKCADRCIELSFNTNPPIIKHCKYVNQQYVNFSNNSIILSQPLGKCCPISVFKAIVKMAITVMPIDELPLFNNTIKWILNPNHSNFYTSKKLLLRFEMIPGFNVTKYPNYILYKRKKHISDKPYMLFNLTYGCLSLLAEIPVDPEDHDNYVFNNMPFPPIPFYTSTKETWDLSENCFPEGAFNNITLEIGSITQLTNNTAK